MSSFHLSSNDFNILGANSVRCSEMNSKGYTSIYMLSSQSKLSAVLVYTDLYLPGTTRCTY